MIVPCIVNSRLVKKHATDKDPWGLEYTKQNTAGSGAYKVASWTAGTEVVLERNDAWVGGPLPKTKKIIWRIVPSAGNRRALLERGDADISYDLPNKDFVELKTDGKLTIISTPYSNGIQYIGMNVKNPPFDNLKVRQAVACAIPYQEDYGRGSVRPCEAHVRRARRCADASGLAAAAQVQHRHRQSQGVDGRGRAGERHRHHDFVRPRLCRRQRAALRAGAGKPGANRHQVHHQQSAGRQLAHRAQQEGAAALHQRVLRLARLPRILLHLVLPRQKFDLQHHELPVEGDRRFHRRCRDGRGEWRQGDLR